MREFYIAFPLSIYSDRHKRFGIKFIPAFYYTNQQLEENNKKIWKSYPNFSSDISFGYYINHYWFAFIGYKYYYYNRKNPYKFISENFIWKLWQNNNFYIGNTIYFYNDIGITIEYSYENFLTYFELFFMKIGYNFNQDQIFLNILNLDSK